MALWLFENNERRPNQAVVVSIGNALFEPGLVRKMALLNFFFGVVTEDALRCLIVTRHLLLDTNEIILSTTRAATSAH